MFQEDPVEILKGALLGESGKKGGKNPPKKVDDSVV